MGITFITHKWEQKLHLSVQKCEIPENFENSHGFLRFLSKIKANCLKVIANDLPKVYRLVHMLLDSDNRHSLCNLSSILPLWYGSCSMRLIYH